MPDQPKDITAAEVAAIRRLAALQAPNAEAGEDEDADEVYRLWSDGLAEVISEAGLKVSAIDWDPRETTEETISGILGGIREQLTQLREQLAEAKKFKAFVHERLDKGGVPHDPDPEHNKACGCRIGGRLNWLFEQLAGAKAATSLLTEIMEAMDDRYDGAPDSRTKWMAQYLMEGQQILKALAAAGGKDDGPK